MKAKGHKRRQAAARVILFTRNRRRREFWDRLTADRDGILRQVTERLTRGRSIRPQMRRLAQWGRAIRTGRGDF